MARVIHIREYEPGNPEQVYIGRPQPWRGLTGPFGNPVAIGRTCPECGRVHASAGSTLPCYEAYLVNRLVRDPVFQAQVAGLRGKILACFCKPGPCHGDVLARWAEQVAQGASVQLLAEK